MLKKEARAKKKVHNIQLYLGETLDKTNIIFSRINSRSQKTSQWLPRDWGERVGMDCSKGRGVGNYLG